MEEARSGCRKAGRELLVDAVYRADFHTLGIIKVTDALNTSGGVNDVNVFTFGDGLGRAFRLASATRDTGFVNGEGHGFSSIFARE